MFAFELEPHISLLTVTRSGTWTLATVAAYETAIRRELATLDRAGGATAAIVDIRSCGPPDKAVADALRAMVARLGPLNADRTAVVTASGLGKLQAIRNTDTRTRVFTSMVLARDWVLAGAGPARATVVHDEPIDAVPAGLAVHVHGPCNVDITLTPAAALETAKRIGDAAIEVLIEASAMPPAATNAGRHA